MQALGDVLFLSQQGKKMLLWIQKDQLAIRGIAIITFSFCRSTRPTKMFTLQFLQPKV